MPKAHIHSGVLLPKHSPAQRSSAPGSEFSTEDSSTTVPITIMVIITSLVLPQVPLNLEPTAFPSRSRGRCTVPGLGLGGERRASPAPRHSPETRRQLGGGRPGARRRPRGRGLPPERPSSRPHLGAAPRTPLAGRCTASLPATPPPTLAVAKPLATRSRKRKAAQMGRAVAAPPKGRPEGVA